MGIESFVHYESSNIVLVVIGEAELDLGFPVRLHLHVLLLLVFILDFFWLEVPLFRLYNLYFLLFFF